VEPLVLNSGILPQNFAFRTVFQGAIDKSVHCEDVDWVNANEGMIAFYEARGNPRGAFAVCSFNISTEGLSLAADILFYLTIR
jgi:hypothetical protein